MKRVLVIEDNENNMELITFILEAHNYITIRAETGQQGVDLALQERPDFIILDIQLPDIMGTDVLKIIRNSEIGNTIPIIAMTSYAMAGDREKLLGAGCDGYIEKPIDPAIVMSQIKKVIGA
ncbi:Polar-differentiation response regulator divK [Desulfamplus magnetovallimortis]|uniref:Polar-differentiation response regulator divK n=1 Tax=Desulfamplus magnetovallimortis TaxID=1246637 RepID=A0A1W1H6T2_9BACT|nr:response regulator [Desulfamplus magnetovallimortis]SLM28182.1 Polar-differentiation response regulator divK [Desulfamplus magnetovallimortis]